MNARQKGLKFVHEVAGILSSMGETTEGPGFKSCFFGGRMSVVHSDYFGLFDLISWDGAEYRFHQVSTLSNKAAKLRAIRDRMMPGWIWCRVSDPVGYRIFKVDWKGEVTETEMKFIPKKEAVK